MMMPGLGRHAESRDVADPDRHAEIHRRRADQPCTILGKRNWKNTPPASASGTASIIRPASAESLYVRYRIKKIDQHGGEDDAQRLGGPHLVLELAAPLEVDALRQFHFLGNDALRLLDEADQVAVAADVQGDVVAQPPVFALDHGRPLDDAHVGHLGRGDLQRPRRAHVFQADDVRIAVGAVDVGVADPPLSMPPAVLPWRCGSPADA